MDKLEGKITYLVPFSEENLKDEKYLKWLQDYDVIKTINRLDYVLKPIQFGELKQYYETVTNSESDIFWALYHKQENSFIGTVRISKIDKHSQTADVGIMIGDKAKWGKGVATDAVHTICKYMFDVLEARKLTAGCMSVNPAMTKVFEKLGFKKEAVIRCQDKFEDGYCDHIHFGCFKDEFNFNMV